MSRRSCPFVHTGRPRVCKVGHEIGCNEPPLSVCAHGMLGRVQSRTRGGRFGRSRVRKSTRDARTCAKSDTRPEDWRRSCPLVHTGRLCVCKVGHAEAVSGDYESVCAHAALSRVQRRTRDRPCRAALVRLCTRDARECAKSDTRPEEWRRSCLLVHTGRLCVCKVGHETGRVAPHLSVCAHRRMPRVHKRHDDGRGTPGASACARDQRPAGTRGSRNDLFEQTRAARAAASPRGCPGGALHRSLCGIRGHPEADPRCARRRSAGRASRRARYEGVREGGRA